jgi:Ca-activated chloride channel family protein
MNKLLLSLSFILIFFFNFSGNAQNYQQEPPTSRILFVFDASGSMLQEWEGDLKFNIARKILIQLVDSLENVDHVQMALRVYGHQRNYELNDCNDTKLEVPFGANTASKIRQKLKYVTPQGTTPIARSLEACKDDFSPCDNCRNIIILVTDGVEECDGDPCAISMMLQENGISLRPYIIGVGLDLGLVESFKCVGKFFNASNEEELGEILKIVVNQALNNTSVLVNLLDEKGRAKETNVNMTFYDRTSGKMVYNFMHTMNDRGVSDTLALDPLMKYDLKVHTIPPVTLDSLELIPGIDNVFAVDAPQGHLMITERTKNGYCPTKVIVRKNNDLNTLNVQDVGQKEKYLTGKYDLEILTLPRIYKEDVVITQSSTTTVEIPGTGTLNVVFSALGYGSIYRYEDGNIEWVCNVDPEKTKQQFLLLPGDYKVVYRLKNVRQAIYTIQKDFNISAGGSTTVNL